MFNQKKLQVKLCNEVWSKVDNRQSHAMIINQRWFVKLSKTDLQKWLTKCDYAKDKTMANTRAEYIKKR